MLQQSNIPIFITHHKPNIDRKVFFEEEFNKQQLYYEVIEDYHPNDITKPNSDTITVQEYSLCLKHEKALKITLERKNNFCIVFEDDIILCNSFKEYFNIFFPEFISSGCDLLMIGTALNLAPPDIVQNKHIYYHPAFRTRCTHGILYTNKAAQIVFDNMHKGIYRGYDHKLNDIISEQRLKTAWLEPGLHPGSAGGTPYFRFPTSIR